MRMLVGILAFLAVAQASAELYKSVDENGNVTYTDKSGTKAKPVEPPGLTSYAPPKRHTETEPPGSTAATPEPPKVTQYSQITIKTPADGTALRDASGGIDVVLDITPALNTALGHKVVIAVDGKLASTSQSAQAKLENVERGEHQLVAQVVDDKGKVLKQSRPIKIQLHRPSVARKGGR